MTTYRWTLQVVELQDGRFQARLFDDGQSVADSPVLADPRDAALRAVGDCLQLYRLRPRSERRGPNVVVYVLPGEGWPLSNLHPDGCKHDVTAADEERIGRGLAVPCAKCGARLVPVCERCARVQRGEAPYHALEAGGVAFHLCDHTEKGPAVPGPCPCGCEQP